MLQMLFWMAFLINNSIIKWLDNEFNEKYNLICQEIWSNPIQSNLKQSNRIELNNRLYSGTVIKHIFV